MRNNHLKLILLAIFFLVFACFIYANSVTIFVVNSTDDPPLAQINQSDDILTLREALMTSEQTSGPTRIMFDESLNGKIINLKSELPYIKKGDTEIGGLISSDGSIVSGMVVLRYMTTSSLPPKGTPLLSIFSNGNSIHDIEFGNADIGIGIKGDTSKNNHVYHCHFGFSHANPNVFMDLLVGIHIAKAASQNSIGSEEVGLGNTITNCEIAGISVDDKSCVSNRIYGNFIGSLEPSIKGNANGILCRGQGTLIGGSTYKEGNIITGNSLNGVLIQGREAIRNTISHNSIYGNGLLGIDLSFMTGIGDGPNRVVSFSLRKGPNMLIPAPILMGYQFNVSNYPNMDSFTVTGVAMPNSIVEIYKADPDQSGYGEGQTLLKSVQTDSHGYFTTDFLIREDNDIITMLCTDTSGNTSEFSQTITLQKTNQYQSVIQIQAWQNVFILPLNYIRYFGINANHRVNEAVNLNASITPSGIASKVNNVVTKKHDHVPDGTSNGFTVTIPAHRNFTAFPLSGNSAGFGMISLKVPDQFGGSEVHSVIAVDEATSITPDSDVEIDDSLDGVTPFKLYAFTGSEGNVVNISVSSSKDTEEVNNIWMDPAVVVFGQKPRNLVFNNNYKGLDSYVQFRIPKSDETYFIAVYDIYLRHGSDCRFHLSVNIEPGSQDVMPSPIASQQRMSIQGTPSHLTQGDLNGDGLNDLVVTLPGAKKLGILLKIQGGATSFTPPQFINLDYTPKFCSIADFDNNGWNDIIVAHADSPQISIIYNDGSLFKAGQNKISSGKLKINTFDTGGDGTEGVTGDFNLDNYSDYALLSNSQASLKVFLNDKHGNLTQVQSLGVGADPVAMSEADFNGDTVPDIAIADKGNNQIVVLKGQGDGLFEIEDNFDTVQNPIDLRATDLDNDGLSDILITSQSNGALMSYLAMPDFDFRSYQELAGGEKPNSISVADINGDGYEDVAVANSGSQDIYIYEGLKQGLLQPAAILSETGELEQILWYSFGNGGAYFGVTPDEQFIQALQGSYKIMDFPHADTTSTDATAFAMANVSESDALVYFSLYNPDGSLVTDPDVNNPIAITIHAGKQIAFFVSDLFGTGILNYKPWMRAVSLNPNINAFSLIVSLSGDLNLDGTVAQTEATPHQVVPIWDNTDSNYDIVNSSDSNVTVSVTCRATDGSALFDPVQINLPANGRSSFSISELFPSLAQDAYLDLTATSPFECFSWENAENHIAATAGLIAPEQQEARTLWSAHFASGKLYRSVLNIINTGTSDAHVIIHAYYDSGQEIGHSGTLTVQANGLLKTDVASAVGIDPGSADIISGYLRIDSDAGSITGAMTFEDRINGKFASTLALQSEGATADMFSHLAVGNIGGIDYFTGLTLLNISNQSTNVHITVYDENDNIVAEGDIYVDANQKVAGMLTDLVEGLTTLNQGYIVVQAENENARFLSFELFGDNSLDFLSAVPAQTLSTE